MEWILVGLILMYSVWVVSKKVKNFRQGKFCSCGCSDCPSKVKCHSDQ